MVQFIYKNKIFITGTAEEVIRQIRMLSGRYSTIRELYEHKMKPYLTQME